MDVIKRILALTAIAASLIALVVNGAVQPDAAQAKAASAKPRQRVLALQGGQNFRDLGGYRTVDGRTVKWGMLYRSGSMHGLTIADYAYLNKLGIRSVCDFRSRSERDREPVNWPAGTKPAIFADDYEMDSGVFMRAISDPTLTPEMAEATMAAMYPELLTRFNSQFRRMFDELLAGNAPLAFNCSAGKDRTGVAAALLLSALGVPRSTVMADYLLSNLRYKQPSSPAADDSNAAFYARMNPAVRRKISGVERPYLASVFKAIDGHRGGSSGYFREELGLSSLKIARLRVLYLEHGK